MSPHPSKRVRRGSYLVIPRASVFSRTQHPYDYRLTSRSPYDNDTAVIDASFYNHLPVSSDAAERLSTITVDGLQDWSENPSVHYWGWKDEFGSQIGLNRNDSSDLHAPISGIAPSVFTNSPTGILPILPSQTGHLDNTHHHYLPSSYVAPSASTKDSRTSQGLDSSHVIGLTCDEQDARSMQESDAVPREASGALTGEKTVHSVKLEEASPRNCPEKWSRKTIKLTISEDQSFVYVRFRKPDKATRCATSGQIESLKKALVDMTSVEKMLSKGDTFLIGAEEFLTHLTDHQYGDFIHDGYLAFLRLKCQYILDSCREYLGYEGQSVRVPWADRSREKGWMDELTQCFFSISKAFELKTKWQLQNAILMRHAWPRTR